MSSLKNAVKNTVHFLMLSYCLMVVMMAIVLGYQLYQDRGNQKVQTGPYPNVSREELREAHIYHGIDSSYQNEDGEWVFIDKQGRECKLFK